MKHFVHAHPATTPSTYCTWHRPGVILSLTRKSDGKFEGMHSSGYHRLIGDQSHQLPPVSFKLSSSLLVSPYFLHSDSDASGSPLIAVLLSPSSFLSCFEDNQVQIYHLTFDLVPSFCAM